MSEMHIDLEMLEEHGRRVSIVRDGVAEACDAVSTANIGGGAFGLMCSFMVPPVHAVTSVASEMLRSAARMMDDTRAEVVGMARDLAAVDDAVASDMRASVHGEQAPR